MFCGRIVLRLDGSAVSDRSLRVQRGNLPSIVTVTLSGLQASRCASEQSCHQSRGIITILVATRYMQPVLLKQRAVWAGQVCGLPDIASSLLCTPVPPGPRPFSQAQTPPRGTNGVGGSLSHLLVGETETAAPAVYVLQAPGSPTSVKSSWDKQRKSAGDHLGLWSPGCNVPTRFL